MTFRQLFERRTAYVLAAAALVACSSSTDRVVAPLRTPAGVANHTESSTRPSVVISQIYGGGGNSGSTFTNDYIELFNPTSAAVDLTGWAVQYNSAAGTGTWQVTNLTGSIPAGGYYLVQEAAQGGGTTPLPTPSASGTINMSATAGKVALTSSTTALAGACPSVIVDLIPYGSTATGCGTMAPGISVAAAAFRAGSGCTYTADPSADFVADSPAPRNGTTPPHDCSGGGGGGGPTGTPAIVVSQIYGGGGNAGATLTNDFVELFNPSQITIDVTGWSVQYNSSAGTGTWQVTPLTGSIPPGGYYLVQEAAGAGGTTPLPPPQATGSIAMSGTSGKVALSTSTSPMSGACPVGVIDYVPYGAAAAGCAVTTTGTLSNTTAAKRNPSSCTFTGSPAADFAVVAPAPRNASTAATPCTFTGPLGDPVTVTVTPNPAKVFVNGTRKLTAFARDANHNVVSTSFTWTSDPGLATVDGSGVVSGVTAGGPVTITATSTNGKQGTSTVNVLPPGTGNVTVSARATPLPLGFQTQLFFDGTDGSENPVTSVTWSSSDPTIVSVDAHGVISAAGLGSAQIIATAPDHTFGQTTITTEPDVLSSTARIGHNTEFGIPADASSADDIMIVRNQYTISWNPTHAGPNWVSWNMDATHLGTLDRCNCFTADTALTRLGFTAYNTNDYITGGLWDRGHMEPSADQTTTDYENANTFFLANVLPQKHDLNAGPWERLENALRDSAKAGREVYTIAGGIFTGGVGLGTLNNLGKIGIPDSTWKIAIIVPAGTGLAEVHAPTDVHVIAVNMPNVDGISGAPFTDYLTTIAKIEKSTGYNFLSLLDESIQCKVEVRNCLPVSHIVSASGSSTATSGSPFTINVGAVDADGADGPWKLTIQWGDGSAPFVSTLFALPTDAHPLPRSHVWTGAPGTQFTVTVSITDKKGGTATSTFIVTIGS